MIVRYLYNGTVYGFQTKLIEYITSPTKLFFLDYPRIIEHHDLRQEKRFPCHLRPASSCATPVRLRASSRTSVRTAAAA
ncbi:MAG: hypothetical protein BWY87_00157 [Deltaproteobacteria bacterium ADurb.Bin510]|jgi:hypothetical protein|nr:MAG: hypothetical protein BWY87_00157 [Deltaproteobacteria bacterium ADurb.Bin510]